MLMLVIVFIFSLEKMSESGQLDRIFTRWLVSTAPACAAGILAMMKLTSKTEVLQTPSAIESSTPK